MRLDLEDRQWLDDKFGAVYSKLDKKVDKDDCKSDMACWPHISEQTHKNTADIAWLKWAVVTVIGALIIAGVGVVAAKGV